jgi:hypothetical protein
VPPRTRSPSPVPEANADATRRRAATPSPSSPSPGTTCGAPLGAMRTVSAVACVSSALAARVAAGSTAGRYTTRASGASGGRSRISRDRPRRGAARRSDSRTPESPHGGAHRARGGLSRSEPRHRGLQEGREWLDSYRTAQPDEPTTADVLARCLSLPGASAAQCHFDPAFTPGALPVASGVARPSHIAATMRRALHPAQAVSTARRPSSDYADLSLKDVRGL